MENYVIINEREKRPIIICGSHRSYSVIRTLYIKTHISLLTQY